MNGSKRLWQAVIVLGVLLALMALGLVGTAYADEGAPAVVVEGGASESLALSLIHISEPTRPY